MHVEGCSFVEAVKMLCDEQLVFTPKNHADVERKRPPFELPEKSPTTTRVEAYLRCRGISQPVIQKCLDDGILYESLPYHNCVFVGRDAGGTPDTPLCAAPTPTVNNSRRNPPAVTNGLVFVSNQRQKAVWWSDV